MRLIGFIALCAFVIGWTIYGLTHFVPTMIYMLVLVLTSVGGSWCLVYVGRRRRS